MKIFGTVLGRERNFKLCKCCPLTLVLQQAPEAHVAFGASLQVSSIQQGLLVALISFGPESHSSPQSTTPSPQPPPANSCVGVFFIQSRANTFSLNLVRFVLLQELQATCVVELQPQQHRYYTLFIIIRPI